MKAVPASALPGLSRQAKNFSFQMCGAGADGGPPAEVRDRAEGVRRAAPVLLAVGDGREAVGDAVDDQHALLVDRVDERGQRVGLPAENHPRGSRVRLLQGLLDAARRVRHGHVTGGAALVQQVHLEVRGRAEQVSLMPVERGGDVGEGPGARVEPVGPVEAVPDALRHDVRVAAVAFHEAVGDVPVVAGEHGRHAELAQPVR